MPKTKRKSLKEARGKAHLTVRNANVTKKAKKRDACKTIIVTRVMRMKKTYDTGSGPEHATDTRNGEETSVFVGMPSG